MSFDIKRIPLSVLSRFICKTCQLKISESILKRSPNDLKFCDECNGKAAKIPKGELNENDNPN